VIVQALQGDTVDALCWRHYGRTAGVAEQTYAANPGLAEIGTVLPMGYPVDLPDQPAQPVTDRLQLWD
jgi:phage tail protein X